MAHWGTYVTTPTVSRRCGRREDRHPRGEPRPRGGRGATLDRDHRRPSRQAVCARRRMPPKRVIAGRRETTFVQTVSVAQPETLVARTRRSCIRATSHVTVGGETVDFVTTHFRHPHRRVHQGPRHADQRPARARQRRLRPSRPGLPGLGRTPPRHPAATGDPQGHGLQRHPHQPQPARLRPCWTSATRWASWSWTRPSTNGRPARRQHGYGRFFDEWSERDLVSMLAPRPQPSLRRAVEHRQRDPRAGRRQRLRNVQAAGRHLPPRGPDAAHRPRPATTPAGPIAPASPGRWTCSASTTTSAPTGSSRASTTSSASETASALSTRGEYGLKAGPGWQGADPAASSTTR